MYNTIKKSFKNPQKNGSKKNIYDFLSKKFEISQKKKKMKN